MNDTPLAFALSEGRALANSLRFWLIMTGVAAILALIGPFDTYGSMMLGDRILYWTCASVGGFGLGFLTSMTVAGHAEDWGVAPQMAVGLGGLVAGIPISGLLGGLEAVFFGAPFMETFLSVLIYACIIAMTVGALYEGIAVREAHKNSDMSQAPDAAGWLSKLPPEIGTDLISIQAQDHYVLAQTVMGQSLIRSSLSDAEQGLRGLGVRVHRSWWVAQDHVEDMVYRDGSPKLMLRNGAIVPVGRAYRRSVRSFLRSEGG